MRFLAIAAIAVAATFGLAACSNGVAANRSDSSAPTVVKPGDPHRGAVGYKVSCSNCHGVDLKGVAGLGNQVAPNDSVARMSENALIDLIIIGRPRDHPDNAVGVDMAPRAGDPSLSDQSIRDIAAYLKANN